LRSHNNRIKMSVSFPFIAVLTIISYFITTCNGFTHYTRHAPTSGIIPGGICNNGFHSAMNKVVVVSRNCNQRYKCDISFCNYNFNPYQPNQGSCPTSLFSSAALVAKTGLDLEAVLYMALLALQFGTQPALTKRFTPKKVNRSTVVMTQEVAKFIISCSFLFMSGNWASAIAGWNVSTWLTIAGIPAALYSIQNIATLMAYQNLDPLTFNVLNQTKTLSAALCCFLIIGRRQSKLQVVSLFMLFGAALIIEKVVPLDFWLRAKNDTASSNTSSESTSVDPTSTKKRSKHFRKGVLPVLLASFISGLAGALSQRNLQSASGCGRSGGRNSYLFTMELCAASLLFLTATLFTNEDGKKIVQNGFFDNWTPQTIIPVITNAMGGVIVGLVTKYCGAVKKGFALIFGLLISGILQAMTGRNDDEPRVTKEQIIGGILAGVSLWMHTVYRYVPKPVS